MADSMQFRRGLRSTVKPLPIGMPGFVEDEDRLIIGKGDGSNAELPNKEDIDNINSQIERKANQADLNTINSQIMNVWINILHPPSPLVPAQGDGVTDDSTTIQNIVNFAQENEYNVVYVPCKKYKCNNSITIDMSKISFIGNHASFDFSGMTSERGFILTALSITYNARYKLKRIFKGIVINPDLDPNSRTSIDGIYLDNEEELDNFRIEECCFMCCNNALLIRHAWRISIDNCLFLWNNHHINYTDDVFDSGENFHFTSCMFADGGDIQGNIEMMFDNCSFDNTPIIINNNICYFNNCHFERVGDGIYQTTSFLDIQGANGGAHVINSAFVLNSFKWQCGLFNVIDTCLWYGLKFSNCAITLNTNNIDTDTFINNNALPILITGKGRVELNNIGTFQNMQSAVAISKNLNRLPNGDAESAVNPFTVSVGSTGTFAISADDKFLGTQSYKIHCAASQAVYARASLGVKPGQIITGAFMYKVNSGDTVGKLAYLLNFADDNENAILSATNRANYQTATDTASKWKCSSLSPFDIVPPGATKLIFEVQGLNLNGANNLDIFIDEIVINII